MQICFRILKRFLINRTIITKYYSVLFKYGLNVTAVTSKSKVRLNDALTVFLQLSDEPIAFEGNIIIF